MGHTPPDSLAELLAASDDAAREGAWKTFLAEHSGLILHVCRANGGDHDAVMDRYLFIVQALRENECRRLRQYGFDGGARFTTWLLVVARRLGFDHHRAHFGRPQSSSDAAVARHSERRQLVELIGNEIGIETIEAPPDGDPESVLRREELRRALDSAIDQLSTSDRLLLRFRFQDDLSVPQIARLLEAGSPFVTYRRLDRILAKLRQILEKAGVSEPFP